MPDTQTAQARTAQPQAPQTQAPQTQAAQPKLPETQQWAALGTYAQIVVDDHSAAPEALRIAQRLVAAVDATCSRFRPDSDLSRASAHAGTWVPVDPLLVQAVDAALVVAHSTDGLVDPTLGRELVALGYDRDLHLVRTQPSRANAAAVDTNENGSRTRAGAWREVGRDPSGWLKVPAGCALDLGATGKAFAADLVARTVSSELGCSVIVSLGGDVAAVTLSAHTGWQVLVSDTEGGDLDADGQVVVLTTGGLATSSTRHRRWSHDGASVHHIIDPRTGRPAAEVIVSATVSAASCLDANAASTAAIILGHDAARWLSDRNVAALIVDAAGDATRIGGWPALQEVATAC